MLDADSVGLRVLLFPIVWVEKRGVGKWRGTLVPRDRDKWWMSYERFVVHYANLAALADAEWFSVGSELGSTETWRDRWTHLIAAVERVTSAELLYSANWDHFSQVSFWRRLDAVGINGYRPIAKSRTASTAEMARSWSSFRAALRKTAASLDRPLILTEVGYLSRDGGALEPWNYTSKGSLDLEEQRRAYAAFAKTWSRSAPSELAGVIFWDWMGKGGTTDRGYTPRGKPAAHVVEKFFRARRKR